MVKIYGESDDLIEIEGSNYKENEIDCYNKNVLIKFDDGTIIKIGYPKRYLAVWSIDIVETGTAYKKLHVCNDENDDIYSDLFVIDAEIVEHTLVEK